jgi:hypothetical protein
VRRLWNSFMLQISRGIDFLGDFESSNQDWKKWAIAEDDSPKRAFDCGKGLNAWEHQNKCFDLKQLSPKTPIEGDW